MEKLDDLFSCTICKEHFNTALMLPCSHNFCALCIRQSFTLQPGSSKECPTCRQKCDGSQFRNNRLVDDLVLAFQELQESQAFQAAGLSDLPTGSAVVNGDIVDDDDFIIVDTKHLAKKRAAAITCPCCNKRVECKEEDFASSHLDNCLMKKRWAGSSTSKQKRAPPSEKLIKDRKPMPKMWYAGMKDSKLRQELQRLGLRADGDAKAMKRRHAHFVNLWNSACDSQLPRSDESLRRELEEWESTSASSATRKSDVSRKSVDTKTHLQTYHQEFDRLKNEVMARQQPPQSNQPQSKKLKQNHDTEDPPTPKLPITNSAQSPWLIGDDDDF